MIYVNILLFVCFFMCGCICTYLVMSFLMKKRTAEALAVRKSETDPLTGLMTEDQFDEAAARLIKENNDKKLYILHIDIDNFSLYKNIEGDESAETALKYVAVCIQDYFEGRLLACRTAIDHFFILAEGDPELVSEEILQWYEVLMRSISVHVITMHFGLYPVTGDNIPVAEMRNRAQVAARSVKGSYGDLIGVYNDRVFLMQQTQMDIAANFNASMKDGSFVVLFQPKYNAISETIAGAEALVRWKRPDGTLTSPADFIPILEHTGLIPKLDFFVFEEVCKTLSHFRKNEISCVPVSVNFSRINLYNPGFRNKLVHIADSYGIPHDVLEIELTESAFFEDEQVLTEIAKKLRADDFRVSIDDFGRGYSSLNLIKEESFDIIKIDQSFFQGENETTAKKILKTIFSLTRELQLETVAEGVESRDQLDFLKNSGCDLIQGYFFSKPVSKGDFERMLVSQRKN